MQARWVAVAKNVAIVAVVLVAFTQLWDWVTAPSDELEAEVSFAPLRIPPGLDSEFRRIHGLTNREVLYKLAEVEDLAPEEDQQAFKRLLERAIFNIHYSLLSQIPNRLPLEYSQLGGFYEVVIVNNGARAVSSVKLSVPRIKYVLITREGEEPKYQQTSGLLSLGKLQPQESVTLVAWSIVQPSAYSASSIRLTHEAGIGDVSIRVPVGGLGQWIDKYWVPLAFTILLVLLFTPLIVLQVASSISKRGKPESEESSDSGEGEGAT